MYLSPAEEFRRIVGPTGVGVVLLVMVGFWSKSTFSRGWIGITWGLALLFELVARRLWRRYQHRRKLDGRLALRTLIIGSTGEAIRLAKALMAPGSGFLPSATSSRTGPPRPATPCRCSAGSTSCAS